jgi:hypothetical protein
LVGLFLNAFVYKWYGNLTDDNELTTELLKIISHITAELVSRIKRIDIVGLLLDDVPYIFDNHMKNYRKVQIELGSSFLPYDNVEDAFDHLSDHIALCEDTNDESRYLKILTRSIIEQLVPSEDLKSQLADKFLNSLIADLILQNVMEKLSKPYQIFEIIQLGCKIVLQDNPQEREKVETTTYGQKLLSICDSVVNFTKVDGNFPERDLLHLHIFTFLNNLLGIGMYRPGLYTFIKSMVRLAPTRINTILINILHRIVLKPFRTENFYASIIKAARNNLFPTDEQMGPPRIDPDAEEYEQIKESTKNLLKDLCQKFGAVSALFISSNNSELDIKLDRFLSSLENERINKHLVFKITDLIIVRLLPELTIQKD